MERERAQDFDQELLDLYDDYAHGRVDRREFIRRASAFAVAGVTAEALLQRLSPNYALAQQVAPGDARIHAEYVTYESPKGGGKIKGLLARPKAEDAKFPAVLVIHENRGLNPYIEDVARRLAVQGFLALAPDALSPLGGYPGNDDQGRAMQAKRNGDEMTEDFIAGAEFLKRTRSRPGRSARSASASAGAWSTRWPCGFRGRSRRRCRSTAASPGRRTCPRSRPRS